MSNDLHERLQKTVFASGLWDGGEDNKKFLLSPSVYELPISAASELEILGQSVKKCFAGLNSIAANMNNPKLGHDPEWRLIRAALSNGVSKIFTPLQQLNPEEDSLITKIDLMEDLDGKFLIAEIDGYNPRGMGYSTLAARLAKVASPAERLPGVAACLASALKSKGVTSFTFLYADHERFYLSEFKIFQAEMKMLGVSVHLASELEFCFDRTPETLFVVFPQLNKNIALAKELAARYQAGLISFLIPPKPYLGSKSVLAILKNQDRNEELESVLKQYIDGDALNYLRHYIPETYLVGKQNGKMRGKNSLNLCGWEKALSKNPTNFVLKRSVSSGMKGVFFSHHPGYEKALQEAGNSQGHFVIQREVKQLTRNFEYFVSPQEIGTGKWHTRVTAHIIGNQLADIVTTARQDRQVHGAPDCLQLGTILV